MNTLRLRDASPVGSLRERAVAARTVSGVGKGPVAGDQGPREEFGRSARQRPGGRNRNSTGTIAPGHGE